MIDYCNIYDCGPRPEVKMKQPGPYAMQAPAIVVGDPRAFTPVAVTWGTPEGPTRVAIEGPCPGPQPVPRKKTPTNPEEEAELLRFVEDEVSEGEEEEKLFPPPSESRRWKWRRGSHQSRRD
ncbi:unnamed protein product [Merluccius merluccius]